MSAPHQRRASTRKSAIWEWTAMKAGAEEGRPRRCVACGKPIVHRRVTALYCSGKCRELQNARKRRQARHETKDVMQAACVEETDA
jgi:predicted nucleic acid-binding Zn ribbon protein